MILTSASNRPIRSFRTNSKYKCDVSFELGTIPGFISTGKKINQVLINLLMNAGQSIKTKGDISISSHVQGRYAQIRIADTGEGIPEENLERLFDPFLPPSLWEKAQAWDWRLRTGLCRNTAGILPWSARSDRAPPSRFPCHWIPRRLRPCNRPIGLWSRAADDSHHRLLPSDRNSSQKRLARAWPSTCEA